LTRRLAATSKQLCFSDNDAELILNYGKRCRYGETNSTVLTVLVELTAYQVIIFPFLLLPDKIKTFLIF
jgi:hypothetical protein